MKNLVLIMLMTMFVLILACAKDEKVSSRSPRYTPVPQSQDISPKIDSISQQNMKRYLDQKSLQEDIIPKKDSGFSPKDTSTKHDNTLQETISKKKISPEKQKPPQSKTVLLKK